MKKETKIWFGMCVVIAIVMGIFAMSYIGNLRPPVFNDSYKLFTANVGSAQRDLVGTSQFSIGDRVENTRGYYRLNNRSFCGVVESIDCDCLRVGETHCLLLVNSTERGRFKINGLWCQEEEK